MLSLSLFDDMNFWYHRDIRHTGGVQRAFTLSDGMAMMWPTLDDHLNKHGVWPLKGVREGMRVSLVFRWSSRVAPFDPKPPYRIVLSDAEHEAWRAKRAQDALTRAKKRRRQTQRGW